MLHVESDNRSDKDVDSNCYTGVAVDVVDVDDVDDGAWLGVAWYGVAVDALRLAVKVDCVHYEVNEMNVAFQFDDGGDEAHDLVTPPKVLAGYASQIEPFQLRFIGTRNLNKL